MAQDGDASIVDVETPLVPGFVYRPFSRAAPTRFALKYFDVLEKSSTIHVALASSVVGLDADTSRSAVRTLTYFHHSSGTTHQLAIDPAQPVVLAGGGISNAQLLLQPRSDGAVPVGNESDQAGKFLMEHPHFERVAELVLDEDLDRQPTPTAFGNTTHARSYDTPALGRLLPRARPRSPPVPAYAAEVGRTPGTRLQTPSIWW